VRPLLLGLQFPALCGAAVDGKLGRAAAGVAAAAAATAAAAALELGKPGARTSDVVLRVCTSKRVRERGFYEAPREVRGTAVVATTEEGPMAQ
jgi:hypothetical protein